MLLPAVIVQLWCYRHWVLAAGESRRGGVSTATVTSSAESSRTVSSSGRDVTSSWNDSTTGLGDIFVGVKTTGKYHDTRIRILMRTWVPLVQKQV